MKDAPSRNAVSTTNRSPDPALPPLVLVPRAASGPPPSAASGPPPSAATGPRPPSAETYPFIQYKKDKPNKFRVDFFSTNCQDNYFIYEGEEDHMG
mmetsp:Transcript_2491/g.3829  ORF Transcript_2491/g.3829 Transcript_2491/m.3829 type:complete len:96 (-) Transcript_2491:44-331(-)